MTGEQPRPEPRPEVGDLVRDLHHSLDDRSGWEKIAEVRNGPYVTGDWDVRFEDWDGSVYVVWRDDHWEVW